MLIVVGSIPVGKWVDILDLKEVNLLPKSLINIIDSNGIHHNIQKDL